MKQAPFEPSRMPLTAKTSWSSAFGITIFAAGTVAISFATLLSSPASACPPPPQPVTSLNLARYYTDKAGTKANPAIKRANSRILKPLKLFLTSVTTRADNAIRYQSQSDADCALSWLTTWADAGAYLGDMKTKQSEYQRKWDLAGASLAYLKLKPFASPGDRTKIEPWLKQWAQKARAYFDNPGHKRNNHWYWLGLGLGATALVTDDEDMWKQARSIFQDAMGDISPNATMPMESARGARALHYHTFAATPLVVLAQLASSRGEDWYKGKGQRLHSLIKLIATAHTARAAQPALSNPPVNQAPTKPGAGWLPLYMARFPGRLTSAPYDVKKSHRWLGGDVRILRRALQNLKRKTPGPNAPGKNIDKN